MSEPIDVTVGITIEYLSPDNGHVTTHYFRSIELALAIRNALDVLLVPYEREANGD